MTSRKTAKNSRESMLPSFCNSSVRMPESTVIRILWLKHKPPRILYKAGLIYKMYIHPFGQLNWNEIHSLCPPTVGSIDRQLGWVYNKQLDLSWSTTVPWPHLRTSPKVCIKRESCSWMQIFCGWNVALINKAVNQSYTSSDLSVHATFVSSWESKT